VPTLNLIWRSTVEKSMIIEYVHHYRCNFVLYRKYKLGRMRLSHFCNYQWRGYLNTIL